MKLIMTVVLTLFMVAPEVCIAATFAWSNPGGSPLSPDPVDTAAKAAAMFDPGYPRSADVAACLAQIGLTPQEVAEVKLALENYQGASPNGSLSKGDRVGSMCYGAGAALVVKHDVVASFADANHVETSFDVILSSGKIVRIPKCGNISAQHISPRSIPSRQAVPPSYPDELTLTANGQIGLPVSGQISLPHSGDVSVRHYGELNTVQSGSSRVEQHIYKHDCDGFLQGF